MAKDFKKELAKEFGVGDTKIVSFRLGKEGYIKLAEYAKTQKNEIGKELNISAAARRLMLLGLEAQSKKRS